MNTDNNN